MVLPDLRGFPTRLAESSRRQHRGQTIAHARVVVRAELSARTKTEEKYTSERLHKALEKRVNKITLKVKFKGKGKWKGKLKKTFF